MTENRVSLELPVYKPALVVPKPARWQYVILCGAFWAPPVVLAGLDVFGWTVDWWGVAVVLCLATLFAAGVVAVVGYGVWCTDRLVTLEDFDGVAALADEYRTEALEQRERAIKASQDRDTAQRTVEDLTVNPCRDCPAVGDKGAA